LNGEMTAAVVNGTLYVLVGAPDRNQGAQMAAYDPVNDIWIYRTGLPGLWFSALVPVSGKLYSVGGVSGSFTSYSPTGTVYLYDPIDDSWSSVGAMNIARDHTAAAVLDSRVYVIGGGAGGPGYFDLPSDVLELGSLQ